VESLERVLAQYSFFKGLDERHLRQLAECASHKRFNASQVIFHEGGDADQCYLIQQGLVAIETPMLGCEAIQVEALGEGEIVGWSWLLPPYHWHFTARAIEPTQAIALDGKALRARCDQDHSLGYELLKRFAQVVMHRLEATRSQLQGGVRPRS
jgi:CRP-like cAMP-binding protein